MKQTIVTVSSHGDIIAKHLGCQSSPQQILLQTKGPHTCNDNRMQSSESQVNLCVHGGHRLPKSG